MPTSSSPAPTMRAVVIPRFGGPDVLEIREVPRPAPEAGHLLVRVRGSALNRADLLQRAGRYPAPPGAPAEIPGLEFAGEVAACGAGVTRWKEGDRVFGVVAGGAHAEYLVVHERAVAAVPASLDWSVAGATPEAFITAHDALVTQASLHPGERVLIHAVGSGVGLAAVQLVRACGAVPYGTARTADKVERARARGLEAGIALRESLAPLADAVKEWTAGAGMDVILDLVGGDYAAANVAAAARLGRIMLVGTVAGNQATLPLSLIMGKRLTIRGTVLRARPLEEKIAATRAFEHEVVPLLASGTVAPTIDRVFPLDAIADAHAYLEGNASFGKVALAIGG